MNTEIRVLDASEIDAVNGAMAPVLLFFLYGFAVGAGGTAGYYTGDYLWGSGKKSGGKTSPGDQPDP